MRKIYLLINILFISSIIAFGQSPANRTNATIVADVLAQMPAAKGNQYDNQMKDLSSTGEEGIIQLVKMMNPPGKGSNARVDYALTGLSYYVMGLEDETKRLIAANAYIKALDLTEEVETKSFIIRQLQIVGKDESIAKLATYLNNESLSGPASRALSSINSNESGKALLAALSTVANDKSKKDVVEALAEMEVAEAEIPLKSLLGKGDDNMQKTVLYALSRIGSKGSLKDLARLAEATGYKMEKTGANEAYIALIKRIMKQGEVKEAEKAATDLMKKATKAGQVHSRGAALEILIASKPSEVPKLLVKAMDDTDKKYRNMALIYASHYPATEQYAELINTVHKASSDVKLDILNYFARECKDSNKNEIIQKAGSSTQKGTNTLLQTAQGLLDPKEPLNIRLAAIDVIASISNPECVRILASQLLSDENEIVKRAQSALVSFNADISADVAGIISDSQDVGKIAALQLLASRKADRQFNIVIDQINTGSPDVKAEAYKALKDVVTSNNLQDLYKMLEKAEGSSIVPIQQAIINALTGYRSNKKAEIIISQIEKTIRSKQYLYYPVLAATGEPKVLDIIAEKFKNESGASKEAAFQALLDWKGKEAMSDLYSICKDASASSYFDKALDRYIQLASSPELTGENRRIFLTNAIEVAKTDEQKNKILKQLSATGSYLGMLLAGEYIDNPATQQAAAGAVMTIALANKDFTGKKVEELLNKTARVLDNPDAEYQRQAINKHLNEMPKEEGFISIFNGEDLTGWKGLVGNPITRSKMKPTELAKKQAEADGIAKKHWIAENGVLIFDGQKGVDNLCTTKQYGDFEMYIDWNLDPAGPEADAGIYLRGTPQVQIWDTARVDVGAQVGSGGLYNNQKNPSIPLKVADNKLGEWNNLYIKMKGDRVTVKLNGELVVNNIVLENFWDRTQPIFPIEQIELQAHGSRIYYRNIYVKELESVKPFELSADEKKEGYRILFDGTNMHEWTGNIVDYQLEDGCISLDPKGGHGGNLYTKEEFDNFIFRFEFQLTPGANNGLGIRAPLEGNAAYLGMELQILDNDAPMYSELKPYQYHGSVYGIIPAKRGFLKPTGEWNYQEVIADGDNIKITLNGTVILDGNIRDATQDGTPDGKKHPGLFNKTGHIGFLGHGSPVKFRNIRVKKIVGK